MPGIVLGSRGKNMNEKNMLSTFVEWPSPIQRSQQTSDSVQHSEERAVIEEMLVISEYAGGVHISWAAITKSQRTSHIQGLLFQTVIK